MKKLFFLLFFALAFNRLSYGSYAHNYNGTGDTLSINETLDSLEVHYTEALELSPFYEDLVVTSMCDDTGIAGFGNDSVNYEWGFEIGIILLDSSGNEDTLWDDRVVVDTMCADSFGVENIESLGVNGTFTQTLLNDVDTSDVSGYACQTRKVSGIWGVLIRYFAKGIGNAVGAGSAGARQRDDQDIEIFFDTKWRTFVPVRRK